MPAPARYGSAITKCSQGIRRRQYRAPIPRGGCYRRSRKADYCPELAIKGPLIMQRGCADLHRAGTATQLHFALLRRLNHRLRSRPCGRFLSLPEFEFFQTRVISRLVLILGEQLQQSHRAIQRH